ncbi:hypothetical protein D210916BOD24_19230 [Alteromonas sp. D210916BOD_24]|uniref:hypothetical protein n=1 Tax=Alteromonas sp. D210916BOD_24 TaxID=3157618 RepID=UPI00399CFFE4
MKIKHFLAMFFLFAACQSQAAFINFNSLSETSYDGPDSFQDLNGSTSISSDGLTATITGNAWKAFTGGNFIIDSTTVLHFLFSASGNVEVGAIGFDNDTTAAVPDVLKVAGWQNYGTSVYNYVLGSGTVAISIDIGTLYSAGTYSNIFLILDKDAGSQSLSLNFSNVELCSSNTECITTGASLTVSEPSPLLIMALVIALLPMARRIKATKK